MNINNINSIYFIGIGGIGMSALAKYFHNKGVKVSGYDKTPSEITDDLKEKGIEIHFEENIDLIPKDVELVVYTPAIPKEHKELVYYRDSKFTIKKRSEVLEMLTETAFCIAVAGTHGKTTTSSMIAHILKDSGYDCTAFLGGIANNFNSNYVEGREDVIVVEADEFDRSFLKLSPNIEVITSIDVDHLDIYGNEETLQQNFFDFTQKLEDGGKIIIKENLPLVKRLLPELVFTYSLKNMTSDASSENMEVIDGQFQFDYRGMETLIPKILLQYPGIHNVENTVAAITVAKVLGIDDAKIKKAVSSFSGIHRRFEYHIKKGELTFIDDYAHHPEEIRAFLNSVRMLYPNKKITAVFQPHLYTRTRDLADGFAEALELADEVILLDIYPAREEPIEGVTSELISKKVQKAETEVVKKEDLIETLKSKDREIILTIGAGDIDRLVKPIKEAFNS